MKKKMFDIQVRDYIEPNKIYFISKSQLVQVDKAMKKLIKEMLNKRKKRRTK
jgi:phage-related tail fiber protein